MDPEHTAASVRPTRGERGDLLKADCGSCFALCCVALSFARSADFAIDKPAGDPCVNLADDFACTIHEHLRPSGFKGCTVFDCFGAGQKVSQHTFGGVPWTVSPETRAPMFEVFPIVRELHELLWYLSEALTLDDAHELWSEVGREYDSVTRLTDSEPAVIAAADVAGLRARVIELLSRVSAAARAGIPLVPQLSKAVRKARPGADLMGADLSRQDLRGLDLRGVYLIAADLSGADLRGTDLIGADLRDADLSGADLSSALFVTQPQVNSARGDATTLLPGPVERPSYWGSEAVTRI